jgi:hypothetical protein
MNDIDYFADENNYIRNNFNLEDLLEFQLKHDIQIIRGEDFQYICYINKKGYSTGLTPLYALLIGYKNYKNRKNDVNT